MGNDATNLLAHTSKLSLNIQPQRVVFLNQNEWSIQSALDDLIADPIKSIRAAAYAHNVSEATPHRLRTSASSKKITHEQQLRLTREQEEILTEWVLEQNQYGYPPSHAQAREKASQILNLFIDNAHPWRLSQEFY